MTAYARTSQRARKRWATCHGQNIAPTEGAIVSTGVFMIAGIFRVSPSNLSWGLPEIQVKTHEHMHLYLVNWKRSHMAPNFLPQAASPASGSAPSPSEGAITAMRRQPMFKTSKTQPFHNPRNQLPHDLPWTSTEFLSSSTELHETHFLSLGPPRGSLGYALKIKSRIS